MTRSFSNFVQNSIHPFFKGSLAQAKRALKAIGRGDFFEFDSNDITKMRKQTLTRGDEIETTQVKLRESPRRVANRATGKLLAQNDPPAGAQPWGSAGRA